MATVTSSAIMGSAMGKPGHDEAEADDDADGDESVGERVGRIRREDLALEPLARAGARTVVTTEVHGEGAHHDDERTRASPRAVYAPDDQLAPPRSRSLPRRPRRGSSTPMARRTVRLELRMAVRVPLSSAGRAANADADKARPRCPAESNTEWMPSACMEADPDRQTVEVLGRRPPPGSRRERSKEPSPPAAHEPSCHLSSCKSPLTIQNRIRAPKAPKEVSEVPTGAWNCPALGPSSLGPTPCPKQGARPGACRNRSIGEMKRALTGSFNFSGVGGGI